MYNLKLGTSPIDQQAHWNELYARYAGQEHHTGRSSEFAQHFAALRDKEAPGRLLELGCGAGEDCQLFAAAGMQPVGLDFSRQALTAALHSLAGDARLVQQHLMQGLPFADGTFSAVFAHLSVHYFDDNTTAFIFAEIYRVIGLNGLFALRVKSVENELYGQGEQLGTDMYLTHGHMRRFFRQEFLDALIAQQAWQIMDKWKLPQESGYISAVYRRLE
jgi:SAM-dependent methyltransferase